MELSKDLYNKINTIEARGLRQFREGLNNPEIINLFHGLRFDPLTKLESILISGYLLPGKMVQDYFTSYNGEEKYLYLNNYDVDNANHGDYISVTPYDYDSLSFRVFVMENLFLVLRGDIPAYKTNYLNYDDYIALMNSDLQLNNYYSYAHDEYFVKEPISIDNILSIGFFSEYLNVYGESIESFINRVVNILEYYNVPFTFEDYSNGKIYYEPRNDVKKLSKVK